MEKMVKDIATLMERSSWTMNKLSDLDKKIDDLNGFKFRVIGIGSVIGAITGIIIEIFWKHT